MTYDLRPVTTEGEACSTCRHAAWGIDRYEMPWHECAQHKGEVIDRPDELVCDQFEHEA